MGRIEVAPATADDFAAFTTALYGEVKPTPMRVRAFAGRLDGRILAIGGVAFLPDGTRVAFADLTDEIRKYPVTLHKAAKMVIAQAAKLGIKRLVATSTTGHPAAERWLGRLGFIPIMVNGIAVYVLNL